MKSKIPKVLIAAPVSNRHGHLLKEWISHLDSLTYPNFNVCLVDTTVGTKKYAERLKKQKLGKIVVQYPWGRQVTFRRRVISWQHKWNKQDRHPLQMLADVREKIRLYAVKNNYDYLFWLDDDIFIPQNGVQKLISYKKDHVGFYVHVYPKGMHKPCVLKSGGILFGKGLEYFTFSEIDAYKRFVKKFRAGGLSSEEKRLQPFVIKDTRNPQLFKTFGVGIGCLLCSKKAFSTVPFRTHDSFVYGEDLWYFAEANEKGFEFWCDSDIRPVHKNTDWGPALKNSKREMGFSLAIGPENPKGIDFVNRRKK